MTINGKPYTYEGTVHAGPNTRRVSGAVLDAVLTGPRGATYLLTCWQTGRAMLYDSRLVVVAANPEVSP